MAAATVYGDSPLLNSKESQYSFHSHSLNDGSEILESEGDLNLSVSSSVNVSDAGHPGISLPILPQLALNSDLNSLSDGSDVEALPKYTNNAENSQFSDGTHSNNNSGNNKVLFTIQNLSISLNQSGLGLDFILDQLPQESINESKSVGFIVEGPSGEDPIFSPNTTSIPDADIPLPNNDLVGAVHDAEGQNPVAAETVEPVSPQGTASNREGINLLKRLRVNLNRIRTSNSLSELMATSPVIVMDGNDILLVTAVSNINQVMSTPTVPAYD